MPDEAGSRRRTSIFSLGAELALWALVFFCPLALGSAPAWTLWPFCALSGGALVLAGVGAHRQGQSLRVPALAFGLLFAAALCLSQLVPLPGFLLGLLSPAAAELREFALVPLGLDGARPLSLDPPATWRELAKHLGYVAVLVSAGQVSRSRRARRRLVVAVALAGVALAVIGYAHQLLGLKSLFGLYAFRQAQPPFLTPFGNANHLAGFLLLSATLALGLAVSSERRTEAGLWGFAAVGSGSALLLSLSRGGIFFFAVALVLLGGLLLLARGRARPDAPVRFRSAGVLQVALGGVGVLAVASFLALDRILSELSTADSLEKLRTSKVDQWPMMAEGAWRFWRAGMGRGAFEAAFSRFQTVWPGFTFSHPENAVLQLWAELGLLGMLGVLGLFGFGLYRVARRRELSRVDLAILAGAVALALHNLVDFNLELPACAVALCIALGVVSRPDESHGDKAGGERGHDLRLPQRFNVPVAVGVAAVVLLALVPGRHTLRDDEARMNAVLSSGASAAEVRKVALSLIDLHPSDYLPYAAAGRAYARRDGDPREALAFVNRALFLRPLDSDAHRTAARSLLRLGRRNQAFAEYQLAARGPEGAGVLAEAVALSKSLDELIRLTPPEPASLCEVAERLWGSGRADESLGLLEWGIQSFGDAPGADRMFMRLADQRTYRREFAQALAALEAAERRLPSSAEPVLVRARALAAMGQPQDAVALLETHILQQPGRVELSFALARQLIDLKEGRRALDALARVGPFIISPQQRSAMMLLQGEAFERMGRTAKALEAYQSASRLSPESVGIHYAIARIYEGMGKHGDAAREVREGLRRDADAGSVAAGKAWAQRLEEAERAAQAQKKDKVLADEDRLEMELLEHASGARDHR
jgi:tetratricopeptide (TPR) repeat protein